MTVIQNKSRLLEEIDKLTQQSHRPRGAVTLIAVSKGQPLSSIHTLYTAGQRLFGENYAQELQTKAQHFQDTDIEWHFIGRIQRNKAKVIARYADWVHGVDSLVIADTLNRHATSKKLNICIQVNVDDSPTKGGITPAQLLEQLPTFMALPHLTVRGLMVFPDHHSLPLLHQYYAKAHALLETCQQHGFVLDTLSMGTSDDYPIAILNGATLVRIGRTLFSKESV